MKADHIQWRIFIVGSTPSVEGNFELKSLVRHAYAVLWKGLNAKESHSFWKKTSQRVSHSLRSIRLMWSEWYPSLPINGKQKENHSKIHANKVIFRWKRRFDLNGKYNRQNERIDAARRDQASGKGGTHRQTKFAAGVMVWSGAYDQEVTRPMIIENETFW